MATTTQPPAIPDDTAYKISEVHEALDLVKKANTPQLAKARVKRVYRIGVDLKERSDQLVQSMERGEAWLQKNKGHEKFTERESQWIAWLKEYEAIEDALRAAAEVDR